MVRRLLVVGISCVLALATPAAAVGPQARATTLPPIVIVMMENREFRRLTPTNAPYLTGLKAAGRYFSDYYGVVHPSFPNYLALASGSTYGNTGGGAIAGAFPGDNLWNQLTNAGVSWGVYQEYMPATCSPRKSYFVTVPTKDKYAINHNPATVFATVYTSTECQNVQPLSQMPTTLPAVSFVTPSYCDDMHGFKDLSYPPDCQVGTDALTTRGDSWLQAHVETWRAEGARVIITFDEGNSTAGVGGHIYTVEVGSGIAASVDSTTANHYSLLAGLEDLFGLPRLNNAATATPLPLG
jgi:phospholipase C